MKRLHLEPLPPPALSLGKFELISNGKNASPHLTFEES